MAVAENKCGVVYAAFGGRFRDEAVRSAASVKYHTKLETCVVTDEPLNGFDRVVITSAPHNCAYRGNASQITALQLSPYEYTLLLDADTYACMNFTPMFGILDYYDVAMTRALDVEWTNLHVPDWFGKHSSGLILLRRNERTEGFLSEWHKLYWEMDSWSNQTSMTIALWNAIQRGLRFFTLPREYECKLPNIQTLRERVRFIHSGHIPGMEYPMKQISKWINCAIGGPGRLYMPGKRLQKYVYASERWESV